ncbi:MAG: hypothetical protein K6A35_01095 [bacterium]|nr:hypothetical protein [bacterium]
MADRLPQVDDSFPKLIPHLRVFISGLAYCVDNREPLFKIEGDLRRCDIVMSAFVLAFNLSKRGYDFDEQESECLGKIEANIDKIGDCMANLLSDVKHEDEDKAVDDVNVLVEQLREMEQTLAVFGQLRQAKPRLSEYNNIDSVLKAGQAVLEGRRDWTILDESLERLRPSFDKLTVSDEMPEYIENYYDAMDLMFRVCQQQNIEELPQALALLKETSDCVGRNYKAEEERKKLEEVLVSCPVCGVEVGKHERQCHSCGTKLPNLNGEDDVYSDEEYHVELPICVQAALDSVNALREGQDEWETLAASLSQLRELIDQRKSVYRDLPESTFVGEVSDSETMILSRESLEDSLRRMEEAYNVLVSLHNGNENLNGDSVDAALEALVEGVEQTRQMME